MDEETNQAGRLMRTARRQLKLSLHDVATDAGLSVSYLSELERGTREPPFSTAQRLAAALQIDLDGLCAGWGIVPPDVAELVTRTAHSIKETRELLTEGN